MGAGGDEAARDLKKVLVPRSSRDAANSMHATRMPVAAVAAPGGHGSDEDEEEPIGLRMSTSMPSLVPALHPDIGRRSSIEQPGGFRRHHMQARGRITSYGQRPLRLHTGSVWGSMDLLLDPRVRSRFPTRDTTMTEGPFISSAAGEPDVQRVARGSSDWATALLVVKSTVGGTLIVIPAACKDAGLIAAPMVMIFVAGIEIYCMVMLVRCSSKIGGGSYGQIAERAIGRVGLWAVDVSLIASQLGFVCTEMLYVATNLPGALEAFRNDVPDWMLLGQNEVLFGSMVLAVPMAWIRHLKYFSCTNILANVTVLTALSVLLAFATSGLVKDGPAPDYQDFGSGWLMFAGTSVFSFECINFVIPMYEAHEKKETFIPILTGTLWGVVVLFVLFGSVNLLRYGDLTESPVTMNMARSLPPGSPWSTAIQFAFALSSLLNIPLFLFPVSIAIEDKLFAEVEQGPLRKWSKNLLRTFLIVLCTCIAYVGSHHINALVALIGSVCCVPLAFIYPVVCHYKLFEPGKLRASSDAAIGLLGCFLFVTTSYTSAKEFK